MNRLGSLLKILMALKYKRINAEFGGFFDRELRQRSVFQQAAKPPALALPLKRTRLKGLSPLANPKVAPPLELALCSRDAQRCRCKRQHQTAPAGPLASISAGEIASSPCLFREGCQAALGAQLLQPLRSERCKNRMAARARRGIPPLFRPVRENPKQARPAPDSLAESQESRAPGGDRLYSDGVGSRGAYSLFPAMRSETLYGSAPDFSAISRNV